MKKYLQGIKNESERNLFNGDEAFSLKEYIKYYVNELRFCTIKEADVKNVDEFILTTEKVHMRLDFEKSERLSRDSEVKYIKMMMRSNKVDYSSSQYRVGMMKQYVLTIWLEIMDSKTLHLKTRKSAEWLRMQKHGHTLRNHLVENIIPYLCMM